MYIHAIETQVCMHIDKRPSPPFGRGVYYEVFELVCHGISHELNKSITQSASTACLGNISDLETFHAGRRHGLHVEII